VGWALGAVLAVATRWVLRSGRVTVVGESMSPTLLPGDRLLLRPPWGLRPGQVVVVADPRDPGRQLVKRVTRLAGSWVEVEGDNAVASTDSRTLGPLPRREVRGVAVWRYGPPARAGAVPDRGVLTERGSRPPSDGGSPDEIG